jgi:hypothetical protein
MTSKPHAITRSQHFPVKAEPDYRSRARLIVFTKRFFLLGMVFSQSLAYKVLTDARYLGQGLEPNYLKFNTIGDILSIGIAVLSLFLAIRTLVRPEYMSLSRIVMATLFSHLLLWLDYGVKRFEASELSPVASIALILATCMLLGTLLTRSNPEKPMRTRSLRIFRNASLVF